VAGIRQQQRRHRWGDSDLGSRHRGMPPYPHRSNRPRRHSYCHWPHRRGGVGGRPDGSWLVSAGNDGEVRIWDPATSVSTRVWPFGLRADPRLASGGPLELVKSCNCCSPIPALGGRSVGWSLERMKGSVGSTRSPRRTHGGTKRSAPK
jgi:WD40 repeat protein